MVDIPTPAEQQQEETWETFDTKEHTELTRMLFFVYKMRIAAGGERAAAAEMARWDAVEATIAWSPLEEQAKSLDFVTQNVIKACMAGTMQSVLYSFAAENIRGLRNIPVGCALENLNACAIANVASVLIALRSLSPTHVVARVLGEEFERVLQLKRNAITAQ